MERLKWLVVNSSTLCLKLGLMVFCAAGSSAFAYEPLNARDYLEHIIKAKNTYAYNGMFNYERPEYKNEIYVHQQANSHGEMQHWVREKNSNEGFLKINGQIRCVTKAYNNRFRVNTILQSIDEDKLESILVYYDVILSPNEVIVAGIPSSELIFKSKKNDRYIYKLAFDKKTFVPLRFVFLDQNENVLEQGAFSTLTFLSNKEEVKPLDNCLQVVHQQSNTQSKHWVLGWMPEGFSLVHSPEAESYHSHWVYGDGVVSFSVFIEPLVDEALSNIEKHSGATTLIFHKVLGANSQPYSVVVVGELPAETASKIASSIDYK